MGCTNRIADRIHSGSRVSGDDRFDRQRTPHSVGRHPIHGFVNVGCGDVGCPLRNGCANHTAKSSNPTTNTHAELRDMRRCMCQHFDA